MATKKKKAPVSGNDWMQKRNLRGVLIYLTAAEHSLLHAAARKERRSVRSFTVYHLMKAAGCPLPEENSENPDSAA